MKKTIKKIINIIIVVLILIFVILRIYHVISNDINKKKKEENILEAQKWAKENKELLPINDEIYFLDKNIEGCVTIKSNNRFEYYDDTCENVKKLYKPVFTYENRYKEVEVNTEYKFPTKVIITNYNAHNLEVESIKTYYKDQEVTTIDTSIVNEEYKIVYSTYDPYIKTIYNDEYILKVVDTTKPVITIDHNEGTITYPEDHQNDHSIYMVQGNTYNIPSAHVTDNSCINKEENDCENTLKYEVSGKVNGSEQGIYKIKYSAKDSSGNKAELTLSVVITPYEFICENRNECSYIIIVPGTYRISGYGAQGGNNGGAGGYISATIRLEKNDKLVFKIGGTNGNNGGGAAGSGGATGGGATTITKNGVLVLTAAGGGANGGTNGTPGGAGLGTGAKKSEYCGTSAGNGISGGGGGSTGSCTYEDNDEIITVKGQGGIGGTSSVGSLVTMEKRIDGYHYGNGKAILTFIEK